MSRNTVLQTVNLKKTYLLGEVEVPALRGVDLEVKRGEFLSIFGPSGSGKSTLLNMLGALDRPSEGTVYIDGVDISKLNDDKLADLRGRKIGFTFQFFNLIARMDALQNVALPLVFTGVSRKERQGRAEELLRLVGLEDRLHHKPRELSGGERQRVALARALINNPSIILADEPTGNLDSKTGERIISLMSKLNEEKNQTFIVVTHDRDIADASHRIIRLKDGFIEKEEVKYA